VPRKERHGELANSFEPVGEETNDAEERIDHDDNMRELRPAAFPESRLNPLRAGHHIGTPQPTRQVHHQENLVESRPQPGDPNALQAVDEHPVNQQHGAADVEHSRGIGDAQDVPRHNVATEEVRSNIARCAVRNPIADQNGCYEVGHDDGDVDAVQAQKDTSLRTRRFDFSAAQGRHKIRFLKDGPCQLCTRVPRESREKRQHNHRSRREVRPRPGSSAERWDGLSAET